MGLSGKCATFYVASALALACSSEESSSNHSGLDGGCAGATCGAGGSSGSGGSGSGGSGGSAGSGGSVVTSNDAGPPCRSLDLAAGDMTADGVLALWVPDPLSLTGPSTLTVDGGYAYFAQNGTVFRVPTDGGPAETVRSIPNLSSRLFVRNGDLVWMDQESYTSPGTLLRAPIGSEASAPVVVADNISSPEYVMADETAVYWESRDTQTLNRAPLDGSGVQTLATDTLIEGWAIVGTDLYWLDFNSSYLMQIPITGGTPTPLIEIFFGGPMVADGSTLFWYDTSLNTLERWNPGETQSTVLGRFETFADNEPSDIAAAEGFVYWTGGFSCVGVYRMRNDGSDTTLMTQGFAFAEDMVLDGSYIYVVGDNGLFRVPR